MEENSILYLPHLQSFLRNKRKSYCVTFKTIFPIHCLLNIKVLSNRDWFLGKNIRYENAAAPTYLRNSDQIDIPIRERFALFCFVMLWNKKPNFLFVHSVMMYSRWGRMCEHVLEKQHVTNGRSSKAENSWRDGDLFFTSNIFCESQWKINHFGGQIKKLFFWLNLSEIGALKRWCVIISAMISVPRAHQNLSLNLIKQKKVKFRSSSSYEKRLEEQI